MVSTMRNVRVADPLWNDAKDAAKAVGGMGVVIRAALADFRAHARQGTVPKWLTLTHEDADEAAGR